MCGPPSSITRPADHAGGEILAALRPRQRHRAGQADVEAFRDAARADAVTQALAARVEVREDPALTAKLPGLRPARVTVILKDGRSGRPRC